MGQHALPFHPLHTSPINQIRLEVRSRRHRRPIGWTRGIRNQSSAKESLKNQNDLEGFWTSGELDILLQKDKAQALDEVDKLTKVEDKGLVLTIASENLKTEYIKSECERSRQRSLEAIEWANEDLLKNHSHVAGEVNARLRARREILEKATKLDADLDLS